MTTRPTRCPTCRSPRVWRRDERTHALAPACLPCEDAAALVPIALTVPAPGSGPLRVRRCAYCPNLARSRYARTCEACATPEAARARRNEIDRRRYHADAEYRERKQKGAAAWYAANPDAAKAQRRRRDARNASSGPERVADIIPRTLDAMGLRGQA